MNNTSLQDAVHKNIILWNLMRKLDFWKVKILYDINRRAKVMSLGRPTDRGCGHWCKQFNFDRLKFLDDKGNAHIYEFSDQASYMWKAGDFNFFPTGASSTTIFARAELLDHLVSNFSFGLKWKKEKWMTKPNEIPQACIDIDLNFDEYDYRLEKSTLDAISIVERFGRKN
jgi:hypothetical protein